MKTEQDNILHVEITGGVIFKMIALLLVLWLGIYYFQQKQTLNTWAMTLIFAGALSNFFDRVFIRATVDYFLLLTGIINLADVLIVVGFVLYLYNNFRKNVSQTPSGGSDRT